MGAHCRWHALPAPRRRPPGEGRGVPAGVRASWQAMLAGCSAGWPAVLVRSMCVCVCVSGYGGRTAPGRRVLGSKFVGRVGLGLVALSTRLRSCMWPVPFGFGLRRWNFRWSVASIPGLTGGSEAGRNRSLGGCTQLLLDARVSQVTITALMSMTMTSDYCKHMHHAAFCNSVLVRYVRRPEACLLTCGVPAAEHVDVNARFMCLTESLPLAGSVPKHTHGPQIPRFMGPNP